MVSRVICCVFLRMQPSSAMFLFLFCVGNGTSCFQSVLNPQVSTDHLITRHRLSSPICILALSTAARKALLSLHLSDFRLQSPYIGTKIPVLQGSKRSLVVFCIFSPSNHPKLGHNNDKIPLEFRLFQYGFVKILRHVHARIG